MFPLRKDACDLWSHLHLAYEAVVNHTAESFVVLQVEVLASTSEDGSFRLWDVSACMEKFRLEQMIKKHQEHTLPMLLSTQALRAAEMSPTDSVCCTGNCCEAA